MIVFDMECARGHTFEGWFDDNDSFEAQRRQDLISCPVCGETEVSKVPTPFAIKRTVPSAPPSPEDVEKLGRKISDFMEKNFDNVGSDFAKEALKMHYGVTETRNIRGVSTEMEEKTLRDEGVEFFKLPVPSRSEPDS